MASKISVAKTLKANGILGTLKTYTTGGGGFNPATGKIDPRGSESSDSTRSMMLLDQLTKTPSRAYGNSGVTLDAGMLVEGVQKWALVDAMGRSPKIQDQIVAGQDEWLVLNVQTVSGKDGPVLYILALRK